MTKFDERAKARQAAAERNAKPRTGIAASMFAGGVESSSEGEKLIAAAMMITDTEIPVTAEDAITVIPVIEETTDVTEGEGE